MNITYEGMDIIVCIYTDVYISVLHGPGLGPRAGPQPMGLAGPGLNNILRAGPGAGLNNILRAGPGAGLKLDGPGRARACKY